jgi:hypothetical protein
MDNASIELKMVIQNFLLLLILCEGEGERTVTHSVSSDIIAVQTHFLKTLTHPYCARPGRPDPPPREGPNPCYHQSETGPRHTPLNTNSRKISNYRMGFQRLYNWNSAMSEPKKPIPPPSRRKTGLRLRRDILDEPITDSLNRQLQKPIKPVRAVRPVVRTSEFKDDTLRTFDPRPRRERNLPLLTPNMHSRNGFDRPRRSPRNWRKPNLRWLPYWKSERAENLKEPSPTHPQHAQSKWIRAAKAFSPKSTETKFTMAAILNDWKSESAENRKEPSPTHPNMHSLNGLDRPRRSSRNRRKPITGRTDVPTRRQTDGHRTWRQYPSCQFGWGVKSQQTALSNLGLPWHYAEQATPETHQTREGRKTCGEDIWI